MALAAAALLLVAVGAASLALHHWRRYRTFFWRRGVPCAPPLPLVGNMVDVVLGRRSFADVAARLYRQLEPYSYAGVYNLASPVLLVRDPEIAHAITTTDFDHFTDHADFMSVDGCNPLLQRMILALKGTEWRDMRTILTPAFSIVKMKSMFMPMSEICQQMTDYLDKKIAEYPECKAEINCGESFVNFEGDGSRISVKFDGLVIDKDNLLGHLKVKMMPVGTSLGNVKLNLDYRSEEDTNGLIDELENQTSKVEGFASSRKEDIFTVEMKDLFTRVANDIIATTAFGLKVDSLMDRDNNFYRMGRRLTKVNPLTAAGYFISPRVMQVLGIPFFDRKSVQFFRSMVRDAIQARKRESIVRADVINLLLQARRGDVSSEEQEKIGPTKRDVLTLTDDDIAAQALIFFFGGFENVSTALAFCSYLLATHEEVQRRLLDEVDDLMRKSGGQPSYEQIMASQYLDMVVSESLRMYPPAFVLDRQCVRLYRLPTTEHCPGVELRPGDDVWVFVHAIHHDPRYFPQPERFDPQRFSPENRRSIKKSSYLPFGSGPRMCIAQRFALMEVKLVLVQLLARFSLVAVAETPATLQTDPSSLTMAIKGGSWLGVQRRRRTQLDSEVASFEGSRESALMRNL
ncbi:cytochrome P450 9e2-like [Schistocerca cancellata]|uniref:cytochrome P450 9e2-like n=1 Tax=Schistocerca cancellata TaxID=274614 RepID=UPI002118FD42|nr:cytochrome P450 9e2-like [Schistocerca cancellata]